MKHPIRPSPQHLRLEVATLWLIHILILKLFSVRFAGAQYHFPLKNLGTFLNIALTYAWGKGTRRHQNNVFGSSLIKAAIAGFGPAQPGEATGK